jgi:hypothetical protein
MFKTKTPTLILLIITLLNPSVLAQTTKRLIAGQKISLKQRSTNEQKIADTTLPVKERTLILIDKLLKETDNFGRENKTIKELLFKAKAGRVLWTTDRTRATTFFQQAFKSAGDFNPKKNLGSYSPIDKNLHIILENQILDLALSCDFTLAQNLVKTIPESTNQQANQMPDFVALSEQAKLKLKLANHITKTDPPLATKLIKESFNGWISEGHIKALQALRQQSPARADEIFLYALSVVKRRNNNISNKIDILMDYALPKLSFEGTKFKFIEKLSDYEPGPEVVQAFLNFVYDEFMTKSVASQVNENNQFSKAAFDDRAMNLMVKAYEKYQPEKAIAFRDKIAEIKLEIEKLGRTDIFSNEEKAWAELYSKDVEALLEKAKATENQGEKDNYYSDAGLLLITRDDEFERGIEILEKIADPKDRDYIKQLSIGGAVTVAMKLGNLEKAYQYLKHFPQQIECARAYIAIGLHYLKKNNLQRTLQILNEVETLLSEMKAKELDYWVLVDYANAVTLVDSKKGFPALQKAVEAINKIDTDLENGLAIDGTAGLTFETEFSFEDGFIAVGRTDFDNALALAKSIKFKHSSALAQLAVCRGALEPTGISQPKPKSK